MEPFDVLADAFFDSGHRCFVTGSAQTGQIALGKSLILAFQRFRESGVFEQALRTQLVERQRLFVFGLAAAVDRSNRNIVEALRPAGAEIENARFIRVIEEGTD